MAKTIQDLIRDFQSIRTDFIKTLAKFPKDKVSDKFFGEWDLKDVTAHFSGWDNEFMHAIKALINGEKVDYWGKINEFNEKVVSASKSKTWEEVLDEFVASGQNFIDIYSKVPESLIETKIWKDKIYTPKRILEINIHHYEKAQLVKIKQYLTKWKIL